MINNILYFTFMKSRGWLEEDDGEVERRRRVTVGKENPPLIQEGSLLGISPKWDQVVVQEHLTVY